VAGKVVCSSHERLAAQLSAEHLLTAAEGALTKKVLRHHGQFPPDLKRPHKHRALLAQGKIRLSGGVEALYISTFTRHQRSHFLVYLIQQ
jgi:hypothetical protein